MADWIGVDVPNRTCTIPGCDKPGRTKNAALCPMHYHRQYRHGSVETVATGISMSNGRRYRTKYAPTHPLAFKDGKVYVHRMVLFDIIGSGLHGCHWCQLPIHWTLPKGNPNALHVDHLNAIGDDNRPENLVPSCPRCNSVRAVQARADGLRAAGWWSQHDTIAHLSAGGRAERVA